MENNIFDLCEKVHDEETFLQFLTALMKDREREIELEKENPSSPYDAGALGWQNITIEGFLESSIAWANDTDINTENDPKAQNPWARAAQIIHAGKTYE